MKPSPPSTGSEGAVAASGKRRLASIVTYGCAKNLVDSEGMAGRLMKAGYGITGDPASADLLILNTCGFIEPAREEARAGILEALNAKAGRPHLRVVVSGCYPERDRIQLKAAFPGVDAWIGVRDYDRIVEVVESRPFRPGRRTYLGDHTAPRALSTPPSWAYLKVSEGCSHECAFCSIPAIKGPYRSRSVASIITEARGLADRGVREVVLISQDTTAFGRDLGRKSGLPRLLAALLLKTGLPWIRFLYGYPEEITDDLLEVMTDPRICPYFDIPFQHADRAVLRAMKRSMDAPRALRLIEKIRSRLPGAAIRTSLIVGFPGEGRAEFAALRAFVREARFDHLGVFEYCREDGTPAAVLGDPVSAPEKKRRRGILLGLQAGLSASRLKALRGRVLEVLLEGVRAEDSRDLAGRTRAQAPEVDGSIFVRAPRAALERPLRSVKITGSGTYDLRGMLRP